MILLQQVSLRKAVCGGSVLYPFCTSVFPPVCVAKNFSDLFQISIFLAVTLCWRDKLFSSASLALCWTCLNIKSFSLNSSFSLWFTLKEWLFGGSPELSQPSELWVQRRSSGDVSESPRMRDECPHSSPHQMRRIIVDFLEHRTGSGLRGELTLCVPLPSRGPGWGWGWWDEGTTLPLVSGLPAQLPGSCWACVTCSVSALGVCLIWGIKPKRHRYILHSGCSVVLLLLRARIWRKWMPNNWID